MIRASFYREGDDLRLTIKGHAGYGKRGGDIVCSAVSAVFYSLVGYLCNFRRDEVVVDAIREGYADIICSQGAEEALKLTCIGLIQIEKTFPDYIEVENRLWSWKMKKSA